MKKRTKKLLFLKRCRADFLSASRASAASWADKISALQEIKVFCFFFSKKKFFLVFLCAFAPRDPYLWPFSPSSPWNTPIGSGAIFARVPDLLAGHALIHAGIWSMPIYLAQDTDPVVTVHDEENARDFHAHIPKNAKPDPMGDAHFYVVEPSHVFALEMYHARIQPNGDFLARRAFRVSLTGPGMFLRDGKFPGVRAMDASGMGGILRAWEIRAGTIRHALTFLLPPSRLKHGPVWPSSREDFWGFRDYHGTVPIGALIAIPGDVDVTRLNLSPSGLALAHALQNFGAYCDDSVGTDGIVISAEGASEGLPELEDMRRDFARLHPYLRLVVNNTPSAPGGGGMPRAPLPPPLP